MKNLKIRWGIGIVLISLVYALGYETARSDFPQLITLYGTFFLIYIGVFHFTKTQTTLSFFVGIAILLRFILIFTIPNFSDDLYRFIWDGRLLTQGINPFDHLPTYYIENNVAIPGLTTELYQQLNSPNYFTIYPPVNQAIFAAAAWLFPNSIWGSSLVMKSFLFIFEFGSIFLIIQLLPYFKLPTKNVLLYALNPLIIIEITGNIHFEGAMIFFLLLAVWLIVTQNKWIWSAIAFALSVASKLLPLMFLPLFVRRIGRTTNGEILLPTLSRGKTVKSCSTRGKVLNFFSKILVSTMQFPLLKRARGMLSSENSKYSEKLPNNIPPTPFKGGEDLGETKFLNQLMQLILLTKNRIVLKEWFELNWKKIIAYFSIIGITLIALFIPLINGVFLTNFGDSLNLYFQKFEFNGSLYYFFRWIGFQIKGYNIIGTLGPILALSALTGILLITFLEQNTDWSKLFERMLFAVCCYLFCSATVHPWYVAMPIVFCLFTRFRFPILWSGLIFLTYINYSYSEYFENLWMVGIEYTLVFGYLIYEIMIEKCIKMY